MKEHKSYFFFSLFILYFLVVWISVNFWQISTWEFKIEEFTNKLFTTGMVRKYFIQGIVMFIALFFLSRKDFKISKLASLNYFFYSLVVFLVQLISLNILFSRYAGETIYEKLQLIDITIKSSDIIDLILNASIEEFIFRLFIFSFFFNVSDSKRIAKAILFSALFFTLAHVPYELANNIPLWSPSFIVRSIGTALLISIYVKHKNFWMVCFYHILLNLGALLKLSTKEHLVLIGATFFMGAITILLPSNFSFQSITKYLFAKTTLLWNKIELNRLFKV